MQLVLPDTTIPVFEPQVAFDNGEGFICSYRQERPSFQNDSSVWQRNLVLSEISGSPDLDSTSSSTRDFVCHLLDMPFEIAGARQVPTMFVRL